MYEHDENEVLRDALAGLNEEVPPMPEGLHSAWMQRIEEDKMEKKTAWKSVTRFLSVAAAMVFIVGGTLLTRDSLFVASDDLKAAQNETGSSLYGMAYANSTSYYVEEAAETEYAMDTAAGGVMLTSAKRSVTEDGLTTDDAAAAATDKKIIRTASLTIQTQTFEDSLNALKSACEGQGGWIESSSESLNSYSGLRTAYLTLRIPQDGLDSYLDSADGLGRITSRSESAQDVTASYQDTQTRLNTQLALMERLQALITESGDLSDLLALESQIADTQYQIDTLQSSLNATDRQVTYSTVSVTLREEKTVELTDATVSLGDRIKSAVQVGWNALTSFLQDMVVFLVAASPFIAIAIAAYILARIIIKRRKK